MSRDDYISKLFLKNQDKLEQAPSQDLWAKLEAELDAVPQQAEPIAAPRAKVRRFWMPYAVAASVLLLVLAGGYYQMGWNGPTPAVDEPLALATEPEFILEEPEPYLVEPTETDNATTALLIEEQEEAEVLAQEKRIVEAVKERLEQNSDAKAPTNKEIDIQDLQLVDDVAEQPAEWISPGGGAVTPETQQVQPTISSAPQNTLAEADLYQNDQPIAEEEILRNYNRSYSSQLHNTAANPQRVEKVLEEAKRRNASTANSVQQQKMAISKQKKGARRQRGGIVAKADEAERVESPMANAHPRLYPFGFLIGKWEDEYELEGKSYEVWTLRGAKTLYGRGYKLASDGTQIFEETFKIVYKNNQVFLQISFEEGRRPIEYLLTSFDQERFVFEQRQFARQPERIVLQQNGLDGYSFTTTNKDGLLSADQQRYLENRNRVSNVRSVRTLRSVN